MNRIEMTARAMCKTRELDPDGFSGESVGDIVYPRNWVQFEQKAQEFCAAFDAQHPAQKPMATATSNHSGPFEAEVK